MGAHLIAMAMLNLRNNQGHMSALNQSQVDQSMLMSDKVKRRPDQLGIMEMVNRKEHH